MHIGLFWFILVYFCRDVQEVREVQIVVEVQVVGDLDADVLQSSIGEL